MSQVGGELLMKLGVLDESTAQMDAYVARASAVQSKLEGILKQSSARQISDAQQKAARLAAIEKRSAELSAEYERARAREIAGIQKEAENSPTRRGTFADGKKTNPFAHGPDRQPGVGPTDGFLDSAVKLGLVLKGVEATVGAIKGANLLWEASAERLAGHYEKAAKKYLGAIDALKDIPVVGNVAFGAANLISGGAYEKAQKAMADAAANDDHTKQIKDNLAKQKENDRQATQQAAGQNEVIAAGYAARLSLEQSHQQRLKEIQDQGGVDQQQLIDEENERYKTRRANVVANAKAMAQAQVEYEAAIADITKRSATKDAAGNVVTPELGSAGAAAARKAAYQKYVDSINDIGRSGDQQATDESKGSRAADDDRRIEKLKIESEARERNLRLAGKTMDADIEAANREANLEHAAIHARAGRGQGLSTDPEREAAIDQERKDKIAQIAKDHARELSDLDVTTQEMQLHGQRRFNDESLLQLRHGYADRIAAAKDAKEKEKLIAQERQAEQNLIEDQARTKRDKLADLTLSTRQRKLRMAGQNEVADELAIKQDYERRIRDETDPDVKAALKADEKAALVENKMKNAGRSTYQGLTDAYKSMQTRLIDFTVGQQLGGEADKPEKKTAAHTQKMSDDIAKLVDPLIDLITKLTGGKVSVKAPAQLG